ncbi:unnamed protein product [Gongylonema pulchrum]|uniref:Uncharacterized protein n=1 Tax=Gongylonema pulchrum TaxID=637853 RepID=A0A3P6SUL0_9BILA|nr:unnamed protein product [Gongylonema pulchrum]
MYRSAMRFLDKGRSSSTEAKKAAYRLLDEAAQLKHKEAMKLTAYAYLFGDYTRWNIDEARAIFEELAAGGSADAQLALGFMHATGLGVPESSQAKALIYYTFSALGGNPLAQMALVCFAVSRNTFNIPCLELSRLYLCFRIASNIQKNTHALSSFND